MIPMPKPGTYAETLDLAWLLTLNHLVLARAALYGVRTSTESRERTDDAAATLRRVIIDVAKGMDLPEETATALAGCSDSASVYTELEDVPHARMKQRVRAFRIYLTRHAADAGFDDAVDFNPQIAVREHPTPLRERQPEEPWLPWAAGRYNHLLFELSLTPNQWAHAFGTSHLGPDYTAPLLSSLLATELSVLSMLGVPQGHRLAWKARVEANDFNLDAFRAP